MPHVINHIGLSSGKDSTALWGWAINESGYDPKSIRGSFCDTENEYQDVYDQILRLDDYGQKHGVPPIVTLRSMGFLNLVLWKKRFPSARARFCTEVLKMIPSKNHILYYQWVDGAEVISHSGVRKDESTERSVLEEYGYSSWLDCIVRRPLLEWSLDDVWAAHKRYGVPINPLYARGRKRVGCRLCCMSSKEDVRITVENDPWVIDEYRKWELIVTQHCADTSNGDFLKYYKSFFPSDTVPEVQRTQTYINKDGEEFKVASIDDVARWAFTLHGGVQGGFDFMFERDDAHVPCQMGYCE